jgi:hypothetical protein
LNTLKASKLLHFYGIGPNMITAVLQADEERKVWELAGASEISHLMAQLPEA